MYHDKRHKRWLPVYLGRKQSAYVLKSDGSKKYIELPKDCPNPLCDGNCPLCMPLVPIHSHQKAPVATKRSTGSFKVRKYDALLLAKEGDTCLGLYSSLRGEACFFQKAKGVPDGDLLRRMPLVKIWEGPLVSGGNRNYVAGKFVAVCAESGDEDWQRIWKRLAKILTSNILNIGSDQVAYRFGKFPVAAIAALCDVDPDRLAPNQDVDKLVLYGAH